jgi:ABC-2 type transport system ATP-binding protein
VIVHTHDLQATLTALLDWAGSRGVGLRDLKTRAPSLEDAFLAVAGSPTRHTDDREMTA